MKIRALLIAMLMAAGFLSAAAPAMAAQATPVAASAQAAQHPHPIQILARPHADVKRVSCQQFEVCFWEFVGYIGDLSEKTSPVNSWATIPGGNRGSSVNNFTGKNVWLYSLATQTWQCLLSHGDRRPNADAFGRYYIDTGNSCATSNRPAPPTG